MLLDPYRNASDGLTASLLHFDSDTTGGSTYTDVFSHPWTGYGSTKPLISATAAKFGAKSVRTPNVTSGSMRNDSGSINWSTVDASVTAADFCIEFFVYLDNVTGTKGLCCSHNAASPDDWNIETVGTQIRVRLLGTNNTIAALGGTLAATTWHHIALTRDNTTIRLFVDGVEATSGTLTTKGLNGGRLAFGTSSNGGNPMLGYIDEIRVRIGAIGSGAATYTAGFTPPSSAFTDAP